MGNVTMAEGPTLLIVKDKEGCVYGGYASQPWERHSDFYGDMKSFLFQLFPQASIYRPTGANTNLQWCAINFSSESIPNGLGFGGKVHHFGLFLSASFDQGQTFSCTTFGSPCLSKESRIYPEVIECWGVLPNGGQKDKQDALKGTVLDRLEGKVATIIGGASGIGECTAKLFARYGAKVVIADVQDDLGKSVSEDATNSTGGTMSYVHCDVSKEQDVKNLIDVTMEKYGKLDIMRVYDVNAIGSALGAKHAARVMIPAKKGSILFTASTTSVVAGGATSAYAMSKHAIVGLTKNLCVELGEYGIRYAGKAQDIINKSTNLKEAVLESKDIAEAAVYLGSDESKYVSGMNLIVDGGYSTTNPSFVTVMNNSI
ncbi:hypothetical protein C5167_028657 [Papaver somniferum]|nr:hypothetical protein C5167_028657 [Papaver somniferum]